MRPVLQGYIKLIDSLNKVIGWLLALILSLMTVFIFYQVFTRYVIGSSSSWSEEISRFLMIWLVLLGSVYALRKGQLLSVEVLPELLSDRRKKILRTITHLISFVFYIVLVVYGWELANIVAVQFSPGLGVSMFWINLSLPVGGVLFMLNSIANIFEHYLVEG